MSTKYVLLVEDNTDEILLTERAFAICHISDNLLVLHDGLALLKFLHNNETHKGSLMDNKPSVIMLDLNLPKISGLDILRLIRANADTSKIPVIVFTSSTDDHDLSEIYRLGVHEYIRKPTSFSEFTHIISKIKTEWIDS